MGSTPYRIALVTHALGGGVGSVVRFLSDILRRSERHTSDVIVLATSAHDMASVRLQAPRSWLKGVQVLPIQVEGQTVQHVGTFLTEFEFQRYQPRPALTQLLSGYDLIQVVAGTPAWGAAVGKVDSPVCLFAASTAQQERISLSQSVRGWRRPWLRTMTSVTTRIERQTLPRMTHVFAESDYTYRLLNSYVEPSRLELGPPGVDSEFFRPKAPAASTGYILSVGRFTDPRKNIRLLIDAYSRLRRVMPRAPRLVLAGRTGISAHDMAHAQAVGVTDQLDILTNITLDKLRTLYQNAAIFVLSSDEEGLGIVILEAMACGLPVISTDCGGPATAIQPDATGLLTPVGDAASLAAAMQSLLADRDRRRVMGQAARACIEDRFSLEAAGRVYLNSYDRLLSGSIGLRIV